MRPCQDESITLELLINLFLNKLHKGRPTLCVGDGSCTVAAYGRVAVMVVVIVVLH